MRICFPVPSSELDGSPEIDHRRVSDGGYWSDGGCGAVAVSFLRRSLRRFIVLGHFVFRRQKAPSKTRISGVFYDAYGVEIQEKFVTRDNPRIFSYSELYIGTNGFNDNQVLGSGGFGRVYKALLPSDGTLVAVKCVTERGDRFEKTFMAELLAVAHLRHRNLVRLRGWCIHDGELLLVYDYMPKGSLDRLLFRNPIENSKSPPLSWEMRAKIVHGLAAALNYLHENLEAQIIHRDIKTSNVLLDSHFNARLGDFGLARWLEHDLLCNSISSTSSSLSFKNHDFRLAATTRIGGTIGYLPPESFQRKSVASAKSDVFSFGIVVLEVVSGRRAVDLTVPDDLIVLVDWIRCLSDEGKLRKAVDSRLIDETRKQVDEMERMMKIGLICTLHDPQSRPTMKSVMQILSGSNDVPNLPCFQQHPRYISLSSSTETTTMSSSKYSTTVSTSTGPGETIYFSAESSSSSSSVAVNQDKRVVVPLVVETPRVISYEEIVAATSNFSESNRVAEVDFGTSYRGALEGRHHVIVKRLGMKTCPALRMRFVNEFRNMERLRHRNLVQLRGWCTEQGETLVVYDYSSSRLLSHVLFHQHHAALLNWHQRYNILKSLASAICYLHEEWEEQVIHRNITSSAIILDQDANPRLGSFALAHFLTRNEHGNPHLVLDKRRSVRGIFGYISTEYDDSGEASTMADVYSYGVVVLEVVTGQKAVDFRRRRALLVERVREMEEENREMADWRLGGEYDTKEVERVLRLGMACTLSDPKMRPTMKQIVRILDGHDDEGRRNRESRFEWRQRNASASGLVRSIQAIGIN